MDLENSIVPRVLPPSVKPWVSGKLDLRGAQITEYVYFKGELMLHCASQCHPLFAQFCSARGLDNCTCLGLGYPYMAIIE